MTTTVKTCFKCKVEKPITEFYVHPAMGDGRLNKCKACTKKDVSENYRANIEHYTAYEKKRMYAPQRVAAREAYKKTDAGKAAIKRAHQRYHRNDPLKRAAHVIVGNWIRDGKLIRQPCEVCGDPKVDAHHDDYSKPLAVRWLCRMHHLIHHGRRPRKTARNPDASTLLTTRSPT